MDYYKVLGLSKNASKDEIKEAFRDLAKKFHPDKHSGSPKPVRDAAVLRFKQASEAYEVLVDDRKRSDYNLRYSRHQGGSGSGSAGYGYAYDSRRYTNSSSYDYSYSYSYSYSYYSSSNKGGISRFEIAMRYLNSRSFLVHIAFAGILFGGLAVIESSRDALWKMRNPGKSFEDAMESIAKNKSFEEKD